ncbi:MAG: chemotaxis protein CheW [Proteobacteria bacterium]|nr:chemotaxis protein CheW [Pseudomonadota bacterium]
MKEQIINDDTEIEEIEQDQYLVFKINVQEFCIQAMWVQEISRPLELTQVPNSLSYIDGVANLRGRLSTVINFRKKIGFEQKPYDEETRIIVIEHKGFPIGMTVDSVEEVIKIPDDLVHKLPASTNNVMEDEPITGIGMVNKRMVIMLDIKKILDGTEMPNLEKIKQALGSPEFEDGNITAKIEAASVDVDNEIYDRKRRS